MQDENVFVVEGMKCNACSYEGSVIEFSNGMSAGFALSCPKCNSGNVENTFSIQSTQPEQPNTFIGFDAGLKPTTGTGMFKPHHTAVSSDVNAYMKIYNKEMDKKYNEFLELIQQSAKQVSIAFAEWKDENCIKSTMKGYYLMKNCDYPLLMIDQLFDRFILQYNPK